MDAYPPEYAQHNLPFVVLSGLDTSEEAESPAPVHNVLPGRASTTISSEVPTVTGDRAQQLLQEFMKADGRDAPWNGRALNQRGNQLGFMIRAVGRVGQLDLLA
jgi:solute carrier family 25 protein 38